MGRPKRPPNKPNRQMAVYDDSIADKLEKANPDNYLLDKITMKDVLATGSQPPTSFADQDICDPDTGTTTNCTIIMKIGDSKFVEIKGTIKPACLPSMHH